MAATAYYEARSDDWAREVAQRMSGGFRPSGIAQPTALHTNVVRGGTGTLEVPVTAQGMGLILGGLVAVPPTPGAKDATDGGAVNLFALDQAGPTTSYTVSVGRQGTAGGAMYRYPGCTCTGWSLDWDNASEDPLVLTANYVGTGDAKLTFPADAPTAYPDGPMFGGEDLEVTITDGTDTVTNVKSVSLTVDNNMDTELRYLQQSVRSQPIREGYPEITGTITVNPENDQEYDWFTAETLVAVTIKAALKVPFIDTKAPVATFQVYLPTCKITAGTPQMTPGAQTVAPVEFMAFTDLGQSSPPSPLTLTTITADVDAV